MSSESGRNPLSAAMPPDGRIEALDFTRGATLPSIGQRAHKEWQHFVIFAGDVELLVNYSVCDRSPHVGCGPAEQARLVFLARENGVWDGDIENIAGEDSHVERGRIRYVLGPNRLEFRDGCYHLHAELRSRPITLDARLHPQTRPMFIPSTSMHDGPPLHWCVIPRMHAEGVVTIDGRATRFERAPAYHDHNWGHFLWGHDLSWEWGFVLPDDAAMPWSVVFVRLTNRTRTTALNHNLLVWKGSDLVRAFHEGQVTTGISSKSFRPTSPFQVPRAAAMLTSGRAFDLPATFAMQASSRNDRVELECKPYDVARVMIPSETDLGLTIFNEVSSSVVVRGRIGGEDFEFSGRSMMELIRHG